MRRQIFDPLSGSEPLFCLKLSLRWAPPPVSAIERLFQCSLEMESVYETDEDSASSVGSLTLLLSPTKAQPPPPSRYALRYGVSGDKYLASKGKSGLTPIEPPDLRAPPSPRSRRIARHQERYQRRRLNGYRRRDGFTTWELNDCGALIKGDAKPNDLINSTILHPLFTKDRWLDGVIPLPLEHQYR